MDDDTIENDVDDDDDMANPFNFDSKFDDTWNEELDEEQDQGHSNAWGMWLYVSYDLLIEVSTYMG